MAQSSAEVSETLLTPCTPERETQHRPPCLTPEIRLIVTPAASVDSNRSGTFLRAPNASPAPLFEPSSLLVGTVPSRLFRSDSISRSSLAAAPSSGVLRVSESSQQYQEEGDTIDALANELNVDADALQRKLERCTPEVSAQLFDGSANTGIGQSRSALLDRLAARRGATSVSVMLEDSEVPMQLPSGSVESSKGPPTPSTMYEPSTPSVSSTLHIHPSRFTPAQGERKRRRVTWHLNVVDDVVVYEVANKVFVDIQYKRNRIGWVLLVLACALDCTAATHCSYIVVHQQVSFLSLGAWASVWKLVVMFALVMAVVLSNIVPLAHFAELRTEVGGYALLLGAAGSVSIVAQCVVGNYEAEHLIPPQFYPTVNLTLVWILLFRAVRRQPRFVQEYAGAAVAFCGFALACGGSYSQPTSTQLVVINALLLILSVAFAFWFGAIEASLKVTPSLFVSLVPSAFTDVALTLATALAYYPTSSEQQSANLWAVFESSSVANGVLVGLEIFFVQLLYLCAARYLDILSLASAQARKSVIVPYTLHYLVLTGPVAELIPDRRWGPFLWAGTPIVGIGTMGLIVFSSVQRQFVERRIATLAPLRRPPNPYLRGEHQHDNGNENAAQAAR